MEWNPFYYIHLCTSSRVGQRINELIKTRFSFKILKFYHIIFGKLQNFNLSKF